MILGMSLAYWLTLHGLVTLLAMLVYVVTAHVLQQRRHPTAAIAWVLFILLVPYLALPAFLLFGSRKLARPRARGAVVPRVPEHDASWAVQTVRSLGQAAPAAYRELRLHADGAEALAALWQAIDGARHSIDVCTFLLGRDTLGRAVLGRLAARARAGVQVRLLLDGLGNLMAGRPNLAALEGAGGRIALFVPPLHSPLKGRTNLRNHRKLLIADVGHPDARVWAGGRNLAGEYFEGRHGQPAWHDLSFDLCGDLVQQAHQLFEHDWAFATGSRRPAIAADVVDTALADAGSGRGNGNGSGNGNGNGSGSGSGSDMASQSNAIRNDASPGSVGTATRVAHGLDDSGRRAQLVASGPDQIDDTVYALLVTTAFRARRRIALVTPYFVPDSTLLMALCMAARRGVAVDLLMPAHSNHRLSDLGRRRALRTLAEAGARIWLVPHMLHAKLVVIDDALALAGSANLDSRSLFLNYELMFAFHDARAVASFGAWFERERALAERHAPHHASLVADVAEGLVLWVGFQL